MKKFGAIMIIAGIFIIAMGIKWVDSRSIGIIVGIFGGSLIGNGIAAIIISKLQKGSDP